MNIFDFCQILSSNIYIYIKKLYTHRRIKATTYEGKKNHGKNNNYYYYYLDSKSLGEIIKLE